MKLREFENEQALDLLAVRLINAQNVVSMEFYSADGDAA